MNQQNSLLKIKQNPKLKL